MNFISNQLLERRRLKLLKTPELAPALQQYLSIPLPEAKTPLSEVEFLVLDFETTGLDVERDRIVSLGYTLIKDLHISLSESGHMLVNPKQDMNEESVAIHELTDDEVQQGVKLTQMMEHLLSLMQNRVLVVHFDRIEKSFINKASTLLYGVDDLPFRMLDTLRIESKRQQREGGYIDPKNLRLFNLSGKYNLPRYKAHHAMQDAISTAELFLAQLSHMGKNPHSKLKELL